MRNFLEKHSTIYQWAARPGQDAAHGWYRNWSQEADLRVADLAVAAAEHAASVQTLTELNDAAISQHDAANMRLRKTNRDLVARLREVGVAAEEHPASKCPNCGSLAAVPEDGKHQMGIVRYETGGKRLFCDGSEA